MNKLFSDAYFFGVMVGSLLLVRVAFKEIIGQIERSEKQTFLPGFRLVIGVVGFAMGLACLVLR